MSDAATAKAQARHEEQLRYFAFLEKRIPELHKEGVPGRLARTQADQEYAAAKRE